MDDIVPNGGDFVLVFNAQCTTCTYYVPPLYQSERFSPSLAALDSTPHTLTGPNGAGSGNGLLFDSYGTKALQRFDSTLAPAGEPFAVLPADCYPVPRAWDGAHYIATCGTYAALVSESGVQDRYGLIADGPNGGIHVATDGSRDLFAWTPGEIGNRAGVRLELRTTDLSSSIRSVVLSTTGELIDVTWNGVEFLVLWLDTEGVLAARVTRDGDVLDPGGFVVTPEGTTAHLAATPDGAVAVVYTVEEYPSGHPDGFTRIRARLIWSNAAPDGGAPASPLGGAVTYLDSTITPPVVIGPDIIDAGTTTVDGTAGPIPTIDDAGADAASRDAATLDAAPVTAAPDGAVSLSDAALGDTPIPPEAATSDAGVPASDASKDPTRGTESAAIIRGGCSCRVGSRRNAPRPVFLACLIPLLFMRRRKRAPA